MRYWGRKREDIVFSIDTLTHFNTLTKCGRYSQRKKTLKDIKLPLNTKTKRHFHIGNVFFFFIIEIELFFNLLLSSVCSKMRYYYFTCVNLEEPINFLRTRLTHVQWLHSPKVAYLHYTQNVYTHALNCVRSRLPTFSLVQFSNVSDCNRNGPTYERKLTGVC